MYFPDRGCVRTLLTLYVYAIVCTRGVIDWLHHCRLNGIMAGKLK